MDDIARIATFDYVPSDREFCIMSKSLVTLLDCPTDDIIKARIRTMGIEEHRFVVEKGSRPVYLLNRRPIDTSPGQDVNVEYYITDVGGGRHQVIGTHPQESLPALIIDDQRASWAPFFDDGTAFSGIPPMISDHSYSPSYHVFGSSCL